MLSISFKKRDSEKACASTELSGSKCDTRRQENKMEIDLNSFTDDIIPATPPLPETTKLKKKLSVTKTKSKLTDEQIIHKLPKTNIIELIESIDGTSSSKITTEESFLSHIENLSKKIKVKSSDEDSPDVIETSQETDTGSITVFKGPSNSVVTNSSSTSLNETRGTKKIITDYFQSFRSS